MGDEVEAVKDTSSWDDEEREALMKEVKEKRSIINGKFGPNLTAGFFYFFN